MINYINLSCIMASKFLFLVDHPCSLSKDTVIIILSYEITWNTWSNKWTHFQISSAETCGGRPISYQSRGELSVIPTKKKYFHDNPFISKKIPEKPNAFIIFTMKKCNEFFKA
jgi:hypothetical protein